MTLRTLRNEWLAYAREWLGCPTDSKERRLAGMVEKLCEDIDELERLLGRTLCAGSSLRGFIEGVSTGVPQICDAKFPEWERVKADVLKVLSHGNLIDMIDAALEKERAK